jgi:hydrogenase nickel incorporation protein HypA/HybF
MHEASIVESLLDLVKQQAPVGARVTRVNVRVGLLTGVSPECMRFYFDFFRENTIASGAELAVDMVPLSTKCAFCGGALTLDELTWICPTCGGSPLAFDNGNELDLVSLEVEDGACDLDRRKDPAEE